MVVINVGLWSDWEKCISYIQEMNNQGFKIKLENVSSLFRIWYEKELKQMGFVL